MIRTGHGAVYTAPIRETLGDLPEVDLAVAYGLRPGRRPEQLAVAAVTLRGGRELHPSDLTQAMRPLPEGERPAIVHVVDAIPVTTWFRPITGPLRDAGLPPAGDRAFYLDAGGVRYRVLTEAARRRLGAAVRGQRANTPPDGGL